MDKCRWSGGRGTAVAGDSRSSLVPCLCGSCRSDPRLPWVSSGGAEVPVQRVVPFGRVVGSDTRTCAESLLGTVLVESGAGRLPPGLGVSGKSTVRTDVVVTGQTKQAEHLDKEGVETSRLRLKDSLWAKRQSTVSDTKRV